MTRHISCPCQSEQEARYVADLLNSQPAREFFSAFVFWDAKRPITIDMLRRLDLSALARELGSHRPDGCTPRGRLYAETGGNSRREAVIESRSLAA